MELSVLGTNYTIKVKEYSEEEYFKENSADGYCCWPAHEIVICNMKTYPGWEKATEEEASESQKHTLRHEIVHAFFNESGLRHNGLQPNRAWAVNEEMVDWIALQGPKIYDAWKKAGAL